MIGLNFQTKSFLKVIVFGVYTRVLHKTLINITNEYMGFQSVLYKPTNEGMYALNPALVYTLKISRM